MRGMRQAILDKPVLGECGLSRNSPTYYEQLADHPETPVDSTNTARRIVEKGCHFASAGIVLRSHLTPSRVLSYARGLDAQANLVRVVYCHCPDCLGRRSATFARGADLHNWLGNRSPRAIAWSGRPAQRICRGLGSRGRPAP